MDDSHCAKAPQGKACMYTSGRRHCESNPKSSPIAIHTIAAPSPAQHAAQAGCTVIAHWLRMCVGREGMG